MIRLNLTATQQWLDLAPGLRLLVGPLTTALMVSSRADPAIEALPEGASQEAMALAMAKAVARRAVLDWEGVGDAMGTIVPVTPEGIDALLEIWPVFEAFQTMYVAKGLILDAEKNVSAPSPTGPSVGLPSFLPRLPCKTEPASDARRLAGLGPGWSPWRPAPGDPGRSPRLGLGRSPRHGRCPRDRHPDRRRAAARDRGGDGA